jgi:hypothetical protein
VRRHLAPALVATLPALGVARAWAASTSDVSAAVVVIDDLPTTGVLPTAEAQVPARWRLETIKPVAAPPPPPPPAEIEDLARAYLNADFLRCLTELQRSSLDFDRLLEHGRQADAAHVGTIAAACALGAGDEARARELVRRLLTRELEDAQTLRKTTPQFQRLADEERQSEQRSGRVNVEVRTDPEGASVMVDGSMRCRASPCRLHLRRGEHVIVTDKLGRRPRALTTLLDEDQTLTVALDLASADEIWRQLSSTLGSGADPSGVDIARAASTALGAGLLVLAWQRGGHVHASVFQRSGGGLTHVAMDASGKDAAAKAIETALREWKTETGPRSMFRQPLFWTTAIGVALVSAATVFFIYRPLEARHDIVFQ